jgi:hypothetical protein
MNYVTPVGLTLFAIMLAGILTWQFTLKFLASGVADGSGKYDAFISYSRQQSDWVVKNVYEPLKAMRKADGTPLSVFFDRTDSFKFFSSVGRHASGASADSDDLARLHDAKRVEDLWHERT